MTALRIASLLGFAALAAASPVTAQQPVLSPRIVHVAGNAVRVLTVGLDGRSSGEPVFVLPWPRGFGGSPGP